MEKLVLAAQFRAKQAKIASFGKIRPLRSSTPEDLSIQNNGLKSYKSQPEVQKIHGLAPPMTQPSPHYHFPAHPHLNDGQVIRNGLVRHPQTGGLLHPAFISVSSTYGIITDLNRDIHLQDQYYARVVLPRATLTSYRDGQAVTVGGRGFVCFHHEPEDPRMAAAASLMTVDPAEISGPTVDSWQERGNAPHHHHQASPISSSSLTPLSSPPNGLPQNSLPPLARPHPQPSNALNHPQHPALFLLQTGPPASDGLSLPPTPSAREIDLDPPNSTTGTWGGTSSAHGSFAGGRDSPLIANWRDSVYEAVNQPGESPGMCSSSPKSKSNTEEIINTSDPRSQRYEPTSETTRLPCGGKQSSIPMQVDAGPLGEEESIKEAGNQSDRTSGTYHSSRETFANTQHPSDATDWRPGSFKSISATSLPPTPSALENTLDPPNQVTGTWGRTTSVHERLNEPPESLPIANWRESVCEATNQRNGTQGMCQKLSDASSDTQNSPNIPGPRLGLRKPQAPDDAQDQFGVSSTKHASEFEPTQEGENQLTATPGMRRDCHITFFETDHPVESAGWRQSPLENARGHESMPPSAWNDNSST